MHIMSVDKTVRNGFGVAASIGVAVLVPSWGLARLLYRVITKYQRNFQAKKHTFENWGKLHFRSILVEFQFVVLLLFDYFCDFVRIVAFVDFVAFDNFVHYDDFVR